MEPFETFEHAGCTIELHQDIEPMSPAEWDTLGVLYVHGRPEYQGMESGADNAREMMERRGVTGMLRYLSRTGVTAVPFDIYEHGSVTIKECAAGDDNCTGYIAATPETIAMTGVDPDNVTAGLRSELRTWRAYFEGEVIGYVVKREGAIVGSCWGFYPDDEGDGLEYVRAQARAEAEAEDKAARAALAAGIPTVAT